VNFPNDRVLAAAFRRFHVLQRLPGNPEKLEAYLARLQNLAGDRPLVMAEIGLDSIRNGEERQAEILNWQIRSTFAAGCAGIFVFSWTDEWHRGGFDIEDWGFGLTDRNRLPKQQLKRSKRHLPKCRNQPDLNWPAISVVVCTYNGQRTIRNCLEGLQKLEYPQL